MKKIVVLAIVFAALVSCTSKPNAHADFFVRGNCEMCKERIDKSVLAISGVDKADWNVDSKMINVDYDSTKVSSMQIEEIIAATGHATKDVAMDSSAHAQLPKCCQVDPGFAH